VGKLREVTLALLGTFSITGWHTDLSRSLEGLTAAQALWKPGEGEHCIWDHVNHLTVWTEELGRTLSGHPRRDELYQTLAAGWPPPETGAGDEAWADAVDRLGAAHRTLVQTVSSLTEEDLARPDSKGRLRAVMIIGCTNHYSYHGSQILLLRRLQESWTPEG